MFKSHLALLLAIFMTLAMCSGAALAESSEAAEVVILYTNDVHTYINNTKTDDDGNVHRLLSYASVAAMKNDLTAEGKNVILVDAGDHVQGTAFGAMNEGDTMIDLMNACGYQLATLGNHEFDYGLYRAFYLMDKANYPYVSCSFYTIEDDNLVLPAYEIIETAGVKVAFIGISTPETITKTTPSYFMDETGSYFVYNFRAGDDGSELYASVQAAIDEIGDSADYIIALGHLGVDPASVPYTSRDVIEHTTGLDAFIDGHSHTVMESMEVKDASGNTVILTQTGSYLATIGKMTIAPDGTITTELVNEYENRDADVAAIEDAWIDSVQAALGEQIAVSDVNFYITDPENSEVRIVRNHETNLGDLDSDAYYWMFNETTDLGCDIAIANGGGIRTDVPAGEITYLTAKTVNPFGNVACLIEVPGQVVIDALEMASRKIGEKDENGNFAESGGFLHVAGLKYDIDTTVKSTVQISEDGLWIGSPTGDYKVSNVQVYDRESGTYEPIDPEKTYRLAGINYVLRNQGDGMAMFKDCEVVIDYVDEDYLVLSSYISAFAADESGMPHINSANSPLAAYEGYLLDYENPYGAGRISINY